MQRDFHIGNRKTLYDALPEGSIALIFAGSPPRFTADVYYPFYANRNFVYLTGLLDTCRGFILMASKYNNDVQESIFILPPDARAERWDGVRLKPEEVTQLGGIENVRYLADFETAFHRLVNSGRYNRLALDLQLNRGSDDPEPSHKFAQEVQQRYPDLQISNLHLQLRRQRTIKQPCEIAALKQAMELTKAGIMAMMAATTAGVYEYQLKAIFDHALTSRGVLKTAFTPIIAAGANTFCIHYDTFQGQAQDGDMVLVDVGACWDGLYNDVSRAWPVNGVFNARQRALYECAYKTSEYMFSIIKPGMAMADVDLTIRKYCFELLQELGLVDSYENVGKLIWHGGSHHIGYDVHDQVDVLGKVLEPGMAFCVDIGIYCEEWGIGFRLEDNCLVTAEGCENLSAGIPRSIEQIEAAFSSKVVKLL